MDIPNSETRQRRAMTTEAARRVRAAGHDAEAEFALLIGGRVNVNSRKKDVIDQQAGIHSVKSGEKKWQIFLYGRRRFDRDLHFQGSKFFIDCIDCFPEGRENYIADKSRYKQLLQTAMQKLKSYLSTANNKKIFISKALLDASEVNYITIKKDGIFHIFDGEEAVNVIDSNTTLVNSKAKRLGEMDDQKVVFKVVSSGVTLGEIEMRNDSEVHYREVKFWMNKDKTLELLLSNIKSSRQKFDRVVAHGVAIRRFRGQ